jgi:uncharacterized membrane protein YdjX (TVP38/TMEM64 family)
MVGRQDASGGAGLALRLLPLAAVLGVLALGYGFGLHRYLSLEYLGDSRDALKAWVEANPVLAPAAFFAVYAVAVAVAFPAASVLTVAGGFLFGWLLGGALVAVAATLGACLLFLAARFAFADALRRRLGGRAEALADGFERDAFGYLLVLRLAPLVPFWLVNIAPALFDVRLATFATATFLGILPGVVAYAWLGVGVGSVIDAARASGREPGLADLITTEITLAFLLLALVAGIAVVVRVARARKSNGARHDG